MPEIYADFIFSLSRIAAVFIAYGVLSAVSHYVFIIAAFSLTGGLLSNGNTSPFRFVYVALSIIGF